MKVAYYPGCSLHSTAREYDISARQVCSLFDLELDEINDWNCCGATSAHSTNYKLSIALPLRNLVIAKEKGDKLITLCAACFNRMKTTQTILEKTPQLKQEVEEIVGVGYNGTIKVRHLLEILVNDIGINRIAQRVTRPLNGLKTVAYYGCLLVRPKDITGLDEPESPTIMDKLIEATGAQCIQWAYKTECCGAGLSIPRSDIVKKLVTNLINMADDAGAQCIITACPLCTVNLETRASSEKKMPIFYFTELLGLSLGITEVIKLLDKHIVSPDKLLSSLKFI
jgi:heterodisulfide reductase subunit B